ncbi:MAG: hypothetical protein OXC12_17825 [Spirochaetaceae bacterium]|nr:hypothetical protein [Spirochaetaceae bacterium]
MTESQPLVQEISAELRARQPLPPLCPTAPWSRDLSRRIAAANLPAAVASALLLWNDDLDGSHTLSQALPDAFGSWLHGTMHRREGDFPNSKYWFHRVGTHAGFAQMARRAATAVAAAGGQPAPELRALAERWDPYAFVDLCAGAARRPTSSTALLQAVQAAELDLLTELAT